MGRQHLRVPSEHKVQQCFRDDYVDAEKLKAVLLEIYVHQQNFEVKWSADRWWVKAIPRRNGLVLSEVSPPIQLSA
jgi:hypothetical protein